MKFINAVCPSCGAKLNINPNGKQAFCEFCGASLLVDDEVQHVQYDNAEEAGYNFEKGRQRAQAEARFANTSKDLSWARQDNSKVQIPRPAKKRKTWLWVLGWILFFPIPLTILIVRNKKLNTWQKAVLIAVIWLVIFIIGATNDDSSNNDANNSDQTVSNAAYSYDENAPLIFVNADVIEKF